MVMTFIPEASVLMAYTLACLVLFVTPGPDMSLFLSRTMSGGRTAGLASFLGTSAGAVVHTTLAAVGLSAVIAASPAAFTVIKVIGALYLAWLAFDAIRNGSALNVRDGGEHSESFWKTFCMGVVVNLANPKVVLFYVTFLPQFVAASDPNVSGKLAFLGLYFIVFTIPFGIIMILGAESLIGRLKQSPGIMRGIDYAFAGIFGAFAVKILFAQNR
jgi:threonine/homoserine/homoserine lactone efflux protein